MDYNKIAKSIPENKCVSKEDIVRIVRNISMEIKDSSASWLVRKLIDAGLLVRAGRNQYYVVKDEWNLKEYVYQSSDYLNEIIGKLQEEYPLIEFQSWEAFQWNYFVNHQIAHNTIFIEVESMLESSVYEFLRDEYDGNVLLKPDRNTFDLYARKNTIIITNQISEAPVNKENVHLIPLEKLIVDLMCNKMIPSLIEKSEYPAIYEEIFAKYRIDESKMFRYARRRNVEQRLRQYLKKNTQVRLMTED